ncbi:metalloregulator ArsR/SmtB family transcription factor [Actinoplanes sp. NPDC023714]|uniref:ArsR/SmtB family transcription factor n=1 Tax=Actinoplanes sp. NPDC023714 TaxID=3154322 RepID=UPI00340FFE39
MIEPGELRRAVEVLRGMAYEHRLHILVVLKAGEATPARIGEVVPAHPTAIAHHLRHLANAGLIRRRRQGRHVFYALSGDAVADLVDGVLNSLRTAGTPLTRAPSPAPGRSAAPGR